MQLTSSLMWAYALSLPSFSFAYMIDCKLIRAGHESFDLTPIAGPHWVLKQDDSGIPDKMMSTNFTFNLCGPLSIHQDKKDKKKAGCKQNSWACAFKGVGDPESKEYEPTEEWSLAGNFVHGSGRPMDPSETPIEEKDDSEHVEGLQISMKGGVYQGTAQKMITRLYCDKDAPDEGSETLKERRADDKDGKDDDGGDDDTGGSLKSSDPKLKFKSYKSEKGTEKDSAASYQILRLDWTTKYACKDAREKGKASDGNSSWGFFTWFIIIAFMAVAAYLIFGSWLNYTRHGARGWDLLPHGDTIRDVPYILKDWGRRVVSTVQGGGGGGSGSRGGYSRVRLSNFTRFLTFR
ncbi:MAG: hypothetical protein M1831_005961 [Alyxoria varia]|nr:MAG: hypothetical protein M1831_005961 [Alyxoria varia]